MAVSLKENNLIFITDQTPCLFFVGGGDVYIFMSAIWFSTFWQSVIRGSTKEPQPRFAVCAELLRDLQQLLLDAEVFGGQGKAAVAQKAVQRAVHVGQNLKVGIVSLE
jgi:hypothetical protein